MSVHVDVDNFVRAETARMFVDLQRDAGGINRLSHNRAPASVDHQTVIRMNRDTLYSFAVVDISEPASITVPEHGERYVSVMVVNEDHHVNGIFHDAGTHQIDIDRFDTRHVAVAVRVLLDPTDPADLDEVHRIQDELQLVAPAAHPFVAPDHDRAGLDTTRQALLTLAGQMTSFERSFGRRSDVDPVHHLIGTAAGWGGLPDREATYVGVDPGLPVGRYELRVGEVPVDAFWSVSVYNAAGYFEPNPSGRYSVNSITATPEPDGTIVVRFGDHEDAPNAIPITDGWNYLVRLYRPRPEILDGSWTFPAIGGS